MRTDKAVERVRRFAWTTSGMSFRGAVLGLHEEPFVRESDYNALADALARAEKVLDVLREIEVRTRPDGDMADCAVNLVARTAINEYEEGDTE